MPEIIYKPQVYKQLKKLPSREQTKIIRKFELLMNNPRSGKNLQGKLRGLKSLRAWPYRIIYSLESGKIVVYSVCRRQ